MIITIPSVDPQVSFAAALDQIRSTYLQQALASTVRTVQIAQVDKELADFVPSHSLSMLASHGLRGELVFPVPIILRTNPKLLGYYRLLYGFSRKEFYTSKSSLGTFSGLESRGVVRRGLDKHLSALCSALCEAGSTMVAAIGDKAITAGLLDDLTLLTLGPQLRGGANVLKGVAGIKSVFNAIREIVDGALIDETDTSMQLANSAGRTVYIEFAPDPDIVIREEMKSGQSRQVVAIEVKAGSDFSNIHNRLGEAEKSHQKARAKGFNEFWTIVNVDNMDVEAAHRESPTTNHFYLLSELLAATGPGYSDFRDRIISLTGIH